jgi:hypothetical protein
MGENGTQTIVYLQEDERFAQCCDLKKDEDGGWILK